MFKFAKRKNVPEFPLERLLKCYGSRGAVKFGRKNYVSGTFNYKYKSLHIRLGCDWATIKNRRRRIYSSIFGEGFDSDVTNNVCLETINIIKDFCEEVERKSEDKS